MNHDQPDSRNKQAQALILEHMRLRRGGNSVSDEALIDEYPSLRDELVGGLKKARALSLAFAQAETSQTPTRASGHSVDCPACGAPLAKADTDIMAGDTVCHSCGRHVIVRRELDVDRVAHFELIDRLGSGGFGTVWRALDTKLDREVAIKIATRARDKDAADAVTHGINATAEDAFVREARAAAQLKHPNIVTTYEVGHDGPTTFIASELIDGTTLKERLERSSYQPAEAAALCGTIAAAVHYAHEEGVIHRDLKPQNVLLDYGGQPHIADFGLARRQTNEITVTMDGQIVGTPAYMSPEQAAGESHRSDRRSDVYAMGVILFEMLTGELPFRGSLTALMHQVVSVDPPRPRALQPRVPRDLETICLKCLEKRPEQRYATALALAEDLSRFLVKQPIHARPVGTIGQTVRWCQRKPAVAALAGMLVIAIAAGSAGVTWKWRAAETAMVRAIGAEEQARNNLQAADQAVEDFLVAVTEETLLDEPQMEGLRTKLLTMGDKYYRQLAQANSNDPESLARAAFARGRLALLHTRMGQEQSVAQIDEAISSLHALEALHDDPASVQFMLYDLYVMQGDAYLELHRKKKTSSAPLDCYLKANEHLKQADVPRDTEEGQRIHATMQSILAVGHGKARHPAAEQALLDAIKAWQEFADDYPQDTDARNTLAGRHHELARLYERKLHFDDAAYHYQRAIDLIRTVVAEDPDPSNLRRLANTLKLSSSHQNRNSIEDTRRAAEAMREAVTIRTQLVSDFPSIVRHKVSLLDDLSGLGDTQLVLDKFDEAHVVFDRMLELTSQWLEQDPDNITWRAYRTNAKLGKGLAYQNQGHELAVETLEAVAAESAALIQEAPDLFVDPWEMYRMAQCRLTSIYGQQDDFGMANQCFERAIAVIEQGKLQRDPISVLQDLVNSRAHFAMVFRDQQPVAAEQQAELALRELAEIAGKTSGEFTWLPMQEAQLNYLLGKALLNQRKLSDAQTHFEVALSVSGDAWTKMPHLADYHVLSLKYLAELLLRKNDPDGALACADQASETFGDNREGMHFGALILDHRLDVITRDQLLDEDARKQFVEQQTSRASEWFVSSVEQGYDISSRSRKPKFFVYLREHSSEVKRLIEAAE